MEVNNILCIFISVQTFLFALKTVYIEVLYIWYFFKAKALLFKYPIYITVLCDYFRGFMFVWF